MKNTLEFRDDQLDILNHHKTLPLGGVWPKERGEKIPKINNNTLKFKDLLWLKDYNYHNTVASFKYRAIIDFDNGWYVSIINGDHTFADYDEYEMAIFDSDGQMINPFGSLTYLSDTDEWMGEVLERLDPEGVEEYLLKASKADFEDTGEIIIA
mgnify:CR=1 FL=1|tara:strand:+ start:2991 stop:3452 length:462 start_codon:yes stop_codon:yes gene_type:complete